MVNTEERFKAINERQAELDARLEATRLELQNSRIEAQASSERVMNAMAEMKNELLELLRLNSPTPPVMGSPPAASTVQGRGNVTPTPPSAAVPEQGE